MLILLFKLSITPLRIYLVTLAGRRWGAVVSGLLIGLPLVSAPISFILACQHGLDFASQAAVGNLVGEISSTLFCLTYILLAPRLAWPVCALAAISVFVAATAVLNTLSWQLWSTFCIDISLLLGVSLLVKPHRLHVSGMTPPRWDLPARILTATLLVVTLTSLSGRIGPQLSGMLSPFPAFSLIFAAFTHAQQGGKSAANLVRGVIVGSGGYNVFFLLVGALLPSLGITLSYLLASLAAIVVGALTFFGSRRMAHLRARP